MTLICQKIKDPNGEEKQALKDPKLSRFNLYAVRIRKLRVLEGHLPSQKRGVNTITVSQKGFEKIAHSANGPILPCLQKLSWCPQSGAVKYLENFLHDGLQVLRVLSSNGDVPALRNIGYLVRQCPQLRHLECPSVSAILEQRALGTKSIRESPLRYLRVKACGATLTRLTNFSHLETLMVSLEDEAITVQDWEFTSLRKLRIYTKTLRAVRKSLDGFSSKAGLQSLQVVSKQGSWTRDFCPHMQKWIGQPGLTEIQLEMDAVGIQGQEIDVLQNVHCSSVKMFKFRTSDRLQLGNGRLGDFVERHSRLLELDLRCLQSLDPLVTISDLELICHSCPSLQILGLAFKGHNDTNTARSGMFDRNHPLRVFKVGNTQMDRLANKDLEYLCWLFPNIREIDGNCRDYSVEDMSHRKRLMDRFCREMQSYVSHHRCNEQFMWNNRDLPGRRVGSPITSKFYDNSVEICNINHFL
jgi:hypothetical protein